MVCLFVGGFELQSARGALLAYDSFSYTNDQNYYKNGGFGWSNSWEGLGVWEGLTFTNASRVLAVQGASGGAGLPLVVRRLNTAGSGPFISLLDTNGWVGKDGTDIWISFLIRPVKLDNQAVGILFGDLDGNVPGFWVSVANGISQLAPGVPLVVSNTYFVVEHIQFGAGNADVRNEYFNPVPGGTNLIGAQGTNSYSGDFRLNSVTFYTNGRGLLLVDELRYGESYADVAPLPPIILTNLQLSADQFGFSFLSQDGNMHEVEATTNLQIGTWENVTNITGDGATKWFFRSVTNAESRFFRVRTH